MPFIYKIHNTVNNKVYIGKSKYNSPSYFGSGIKINQALKKYGRDKFVKSLLEECDNASVNAREIYWIDFYQATNDALGYNISKGGDGGDHYWATLTNEDRAIHNKKISDSKIGISHAPHSELTKKKMSEAFNHDPVYLKQRAQKLCKMYTCINHLTGEKVHPANLKDFCKERGISYAAMQGHARRYGKRSALVEEVWSCAPGMLSGTVESIVASVNAEIILTKVAIKEKMRGKNNKGEHNPMWGRKHSDATKEKIRQKYLERKVND